MKRATLYICCAILLAMSIVISCTYQPRSTHSDWALSPQQLDSIKFSELHHYNVGYNFVLSADSMQLRSAPSNYTLNLDYAPDSAMLVKGEDFVVTEIFRNPVAEGKSDSIWLRVGSDEVPLGWVSESEMLSNATPVDPISQFIHWCKSNDVLILMVFVAIYFICILMMRSRKTFPFVVSHNKISIYPVAFLICIAIAGTLHAFVFRFSYDSWQEFYFHPSLNPFCLPPLMALHIGSVWLCLLLYLSSYFELKSRIPTGQLALTMIAFLFCGLVFYIGTSFEGDPLIAIIFLLIIIGTVIWKYVKIRRNIKISTVEALDNKEK